MLYCDSYIWQWIFSSFFQCRQKPECHRNFKHYKQIMPILNSLFLLLPFGERGQFGCNSVGTNSYEATDKKAYEWIYHSAMWGNKQLHHFQQAAIYTCKMVALSPRYNLSKEALNRELWQTLKIVGFLLRFYFLFCNSCSGYLQLLPHFYVVSPKEWIERNSSF